MYVCKDFLVYRVSNWKLIDNFLTSFARSLDLFFLFWHRVCVHVELKKITKTKLIKLENDERRITFPVICKLDSNIFLLFLLLCP